MVIFYLLFRLSSQQDFELAVQDISDDPLTMDGWQVSRKREFKAYASSIQKCNQNLLKLTPYPNIYQKNYQITHFEYDQIIFEMDVYFIQFQESLIRIKIDETIIFQQTFTSNTLKQNSVCGGSDSYFTINQKFYSKQTQFYLIIFYQTSDPNSYIGIRNINFYTNGYSLSNGCPMETPYLQDSECVYYCTNPSAYLGGVDMLVCQTDETGEQSNLLNEYYATQSNVWKFSDPNPSTYQKQYLTNDYHLRRKNYYDNIMISALFSSSLTCYQSCYYLTQQIEPTYLLQITLAFYIFNQWNDGSFVGIYIEGDTIYKNNMVKIFKANGKYYSSTGSKFHFTNITNTQGLVSTVRRILITFQGNFYSSNVKIGFSQAIYGSGYYGFGTLYVYQSYSDPNIVQSGLYGIPFQCAYDYYAYNGYCVQNCPPYSQQDDNNNNCTDLSYQQSQIFESSYQQSNRVGTYIVKDFYNNNFNQQTINSIFKLMPPTYNNYQNGQPFSFIGNKKILGGFNSWGHGSYGLYFNLPIHNQIRIYFKLYMIDNWSPQDYFRVTLDSSVSQQQNKDNPNKQIQGLNTLDQVFDFNFVQPHTASTLKLIFLCNIAQKDPSLASCGISDLFILYDQFVDVFCNSTTIYYSYFTNNCEQCIGVNCVLYPTNYYLNGLSEKELFGCQERNQGNPNECLTCSEPSYKKNGLVCVCGDNYILRDYQCIQCHYTCETCSGLTENDCLTCGNTRQLVGQSCQCLSNEIEVFAQYLCAGFSAQCDYSCETCFAMKYYHCATCPINSFRSLNQYKSCLCDEQYMDVGSPICQKIICDPSCLTCNGILKSNCLQCQPNFRYDNGYCICDGQFNNLVDVNVCTINTQTCNDMTCIDQSIEGLLDCDSNLSRYLNIISNQQQQCVCFDGYYDSQGVCVICQQSCLTCQTTATNCLSCDSNNNRELNINKCDCISGYNDKLAPSQSCVINYAVCHYSCNQCFGPSDGECLNCNQNRTLQGSYCPCVPQRYEDANSNSCLLCNSLCLTCNGDQFNNCLSCDHSLHRTLSQNSCICQQGYIEVDGVCNPCHYSCLSCLGMESQNCTDCDALDFRLINYKNQCKCISGYADIGNKLCEKCPSDCDDCDSQLKCISCKYQLQFINSAGRCECQEGYQKDNNGQCIDCQSEQGKAMFLCQYRNAQDGVWTYGEQCDDGNNDSRDGCNNNQITYGYSCTNVFNQPSICYKCPSNCQQCQLQQNQVICIACYSNYSINQSECIQCLEESCIECNTPSYCIVCNNQKIPNQGKCNTCDYGYYYENNECQSQCGDGIKTNYEQCDDGNLISSDGCSEICEIEDDFVCQTTNKLSNCFIHEQPYLVLNISYQTSNKERQLIITVSQDVQYKDVQVDINQNEQITAVSKISGTSSLIIDLNLSFNQSFSKVTIDLTVQGIIQNQYNQTLKSNKLQVMLENIFVLDAEQQQQCDQITKVGQSVVISVACLSATSILLGGTSQFISFLNLISQLQYIQYINVNIPENLIQFLNLFNGFTISPLFQLFEMDITYETPSQEIFAYNDVNAYFFANIKGFLLALTLSFITYLLSLLFVQLLETYKQSQLKSGDLTIYHYKRYNKILVIVIKMAQKIKQQTVSQLILTTCYDIIFAIFLQINNPHVDDIDKLLNLIFAYVALIYLFKFICTKIINEEIKVGRWQTLYNQLKLLQSLIFVIAIVQLQDFPQSQVFCISLSSLIITFYIYNFRPFKSAFNNYRIILQEVMLFVIILTCLVYDYFPSQINPISLGWFHIASLLLLIIGSFVIDIFDFAIVIQKMN